MKTIKESFVLNHESCDKIAELIMAFCQGINVERKDILRYRLSAEECLLYWMEHGLEGECVTFQAGSFMRSFYVTLEVKGEGLDPYAENDEQYGSYADNVLVNLGLSPEYSYTEGRNRIRFRVRKKPRSQMLTFFMILVMALLIGLVGNKVLSADIRNKLLDIAINPLYDTFFKMLGCIAGPMIFMSVAWGVYGIGDAETFNRIGRKMMIRYALITMAAAAAGSMFFPFLGPKLSVTGASGGQIESIIQMILDIIPSTIVEPFSTGNTLQIIFLAIVIGISLLYLGRQTGSLANGINQVNVLVQFLMRFISRLVPFVIFLVIISMVWSGKIKVVLTAWKLFAVALIAVVLIAVVYTVVTSVRMKVSPFLLQRKSLPTFLIALATASSAASFESNVNTCEKKFGINLSFVRFGIPLGMVIHKPVTAVYNILLVFFFAKQYNVSCSVGWLCIALIVTGIISIATPPIPGGGAIAYAVLFRQLGIPAEALTIAMALDMVTDFFITAFDMYALQITMINISSGMKMIDPEVLREKV